MHRSNIKPNPPDGLAKLSRRNFMGAAGSALVPASLSILGSGPSASSAEAGPPKAESNNSSLHLNEGSFFCGRQYFVLRSGRAQMILQADRADLGPALTFLLFDSKNPRQSARKAGALNYVVGEGVTSSALQVELGGFTFTALGHRTTTQWVISDGVPAVEAVWWAGGIRVTEQFLAQSGTGVFQRSIRLEGADLAGEQAVTLRLSLPAGRFRGQGPVLVWDGESSQLALVVHGGVARQSDPSGGCVNIGPLTIAPQSAVQLETELLVQIPAADLNEVMNRAVALVPASPVGMRSAAKQMWAAASQVTTQDSTIQELFNKARYGLPGMIADDGSMDAGIFEYGLQWARDTSNSALGTIHAGFFEIARAALEHVLTKMITEQGATMISSGYDEVNREELDQMGEVLHALKAYSDWTGDDSLIRENRTKILAMIERPLTAFFRDETGMVHSRREYWERTFEDAYELAYQTYVIQGLRDAADIASSLSAQEHAASWRREADRTLQSMLNHPTRALVHQGHLIKRRNLTGEVAGWLRSSEGCNPGAPSCTDSCHRIEPDASAALPIALGVVDPGALIARNTLDQLESLWNMRWSDGGYERYNTSSQLDQPGPWPFATCFILRAQHEAKLFDRSRRTLEWLNSVPGSGSGCWFEEIPSIRSQSPYSGLIPWTSAEIIVFAVRHWLGIKFQNGRTVIHPNLYPGSGPVSADLRFRKGRLRVEIDGSGPIKKARVDGTKVEPAHNGSLILPADFVSGTVVIHTKH